MFAFSKPYADRVARLRVPAGFLLLAAFVWISRPNVLSLAAGLPISFAGLCLRAWAAGCVVKNEQLATGGPYTYTRNPLYLGTLLAAAGFAIASRSSLLAALFALVFIFAYLPVIELEEQHLRKLFPEYAEYAASVPRFWPKPVPAKSRAPFRWSLYLKNREYQAGAAFAAGVFLLVWKVLFS